MTAIKYDKMVEGNYKTLEKSNLSKANKQHIKTFLDEYGTDNNLGDARKNKYLTTFKKAVEILGKDLDKATINDIRNMINKIKTHHERGHEVSEATKKDYFITLKTFYKWYEKNKTPSEELQETIKYLKEFYFKMDKDKITERDALTEEEIHKMIKTAKTPRDKCILAMLWDTGARASELLTLRNKDIKPFEYGFRVYIWQSKTEKRTLPIIESKDYIANYINNKPDFDEKDRPFWIDKWGEALSYDGLRVQIHKISQRAGIKRRIYPHLFRHSRASYLANKGWNEPALCTWFGWKIGGDTPREYIKKKDIHLEDPMLQMLGLKQAEEREKGVLASVKCYHCGTINEATNEFCKQCSRGLTEELIKEREQEQKDLIEQLINEKVREALAEYKEKNTK